MYQIGTKSQQLTLRLAIFSIVSNVKSPCNKAWTLYPLWLGNLLNAITLDGSVLAGVLKEQKSHRVIRCS